MNPTINPVRASLQRGMGYAKDAEKYLKAVLAEWRVIRLTEKQLEIGTIEKVLAFIPHEAAPATSE